MDIKLCQFLWTTIFCSASFLLCRIFYRRYTLSNLAFNMCGVKHFAYTKSTQFHIWNQWQIQFYDYHNFYADQIQRVFFLVRNRVHKRRRYRILTTSECRTQCLYERNKIWNCVTQVISTKWQKFTIDKIMSVGWFYLYLCMESESFTNFL